MDARFEMSFPVMCSADVQDGDADLAHPAEIAADARAAAGAGASRGRVPQPALVDPGPGGQVPMAVQSAPPGPMVHPSKHQQQQQLPHSLYSHALLSRGHVEPSPDPTTGAMSPSLSSVATSNSEVSFKIEE
ncbi:hypothetical protein TSAR_001845 [Trichomalopsis sarcophagae]|uniref:Uncharacterized protein n=1 Tax=Trichomalopsis sarcophagae TaxID=543379 RepID=A0A232F568_9HYME|nr:hypothetical protein TSAR_001845 [Trichomalopsis sarcophagae]